jgi:starch synthase
MRILLASSELHPYSKTGGLADMVGALSKALVRAGHQVGVVTPLYAGIREAFHDLKQAGMPLAIQLGNTTVRGEVWTREPTQGLTVYFLDQPGFFQRPGIYGQNGSDYADNADRFIFFSKAVAHLGSHLPWKPEVLHLNDWQTGFAALFTQQQNKGGTHTPRSCMTIHNLAYQGLFPTAKYPLTGLPWDYFISDGVEFYGQMSCLKAGIVYADVVTTVSPRYAREIMTEEFGCGFDGLLRRRQSSLFGILNAVDYEEWSPGSDPYVSSRYSRQDLAGKQEDKMALLKEFGLPTDSNKPLFGSIGRLVEQKGADLMLGALEEMLGTGLQFVLIGTGTPQFENAFRELARRFPSQVAVRVGFDEGLSHRMEAGCDFFLMPSRFEPCGLNQMYSLRYGTIPIVRAIGGLDDTVRDIREDAENANGIKFHEYSSRALAKAIRKALVLYEERPLFERFRENAMRAEFSWDQSAQEYLGVYRRAVATV